MLSVPEVSIKTLVPPTSLSPNITGIFASLDCLFINKPRSKSSNSFVPKSSISGTFGLNTQAKNNVTPRDTKGLPKKPFALVTTFVTALTIPLNPPKNDLIPVFVVELSRDLLTIIFQNRLSLKLFQVLNL